MIICPGREVGPESVIPRASQTTSLSGFYLKEMSKTGILKYSTDEVNMAQPLINSEILKKSFNVSKLRYLHLKRG